MVVDARSRGHLLRYLLRLPEDALLDDLFEAFYGNKRISDWLVKVPVRSHDVQSKWGRRKRDKLFVRDGAIASHGQI